MSLLVLFNTYPGPFSGTGTPSLSGATGAGTGALSFSGAGGASLVAAIGAGTASLSFSGAGDTSTGAATGAGSGTVTFEASGNPSASPVAGTGTGTLGYVGTGDANLSSGTTAGDGTLTFLGEGDAFLPAAIAVGSGTFTPIEEPPLEPPAPDATPRQASYAWDSSWYDSPRIRDTSEYQPEPKPVIPEPAPLPVFFGQGTVIVSRVQVSGRAAVVNPKPIIATGVITFPRIQARGTATVGVGKQEREIELLLSL